MVTKRVLFLCLHNSGRSQIAEAYLTKLGGENFIAESAGFEPKPINPFVIEVLKEEGIDISQKKSKGVFSLFKQGHIYHYVIRVCNIAAQEQCPIYPTMAEMIDWSFEDPSKVIGSDEEKLEKIRQIRDEIKKQILSFIQVMKTNSPILNKQK